MKDKIEKTLYLTKEEKKVLELLLMGVDLERAGFENDQIDLIEDIYKRLIKKDK